MAYWIVFPETVSLLVNLSMDIEYIIKKRLEQDVASSAGGIDGLISGNWRMIRLLDEMDAWDRM